VLFDDERDKPTTVIVLGFIYLLNLIQHLPLFFSSLFIKQLQVCQSDPQATLLLQLFSYGTLADYKGVLRLCFLQKKLFSSRFL
jgi:hypothetical protein